jgi:hypothetical protein
LAARVHTAPFTAFFVEWWASTVIYAYDRRLLTYITAHHRYGTNDPYGVTEGMEVRSRRSYA